MSIRTQKRKLKKPPVKTDNGLPPAGRGRVDRVSLTVEMLVLNEAGKVEKPMPLNPNLICSANFHKTIKELLLEGGIDPTHLE
jgi:hypothetical protein